MKESAISVSVECMFFDEWRRDDESHFSFTNGVYIIMVSVVWRRELLNAVGARMAWIVLDE